MFGNMRVAFAPPQSPRIPHPILPAALSLFFYIEEAWWFLLDTVEALCGRVVLSFASFVACWHECNGIPGLAVGDSVLPLVEQFEVHKRAVPVCCGLLVSDDEHLLLVRATVSRRRNWMLPGGKCKVHENEDAETCVTREVMEETGLDISPYPRQMFNVTTARRPVTIFMVRGMPRLPLPPIPNLKEISRVEWIDLDAAQRMPRLNPLVWQVLPMVLRRPWRREEPPTQKSARVQ
jgi:8-oxo-dGTP pyrophosphatase MutT (NUDIX family)